MVAGYLHDDVLLLLVGELLPVDLRLLLPVVHTGCSRHIRDIVIKSSVSVLSVEPPMDSTEDSSLELSPSYERDNARMKEEEE